MNQLDQELEARKKAEEAKKAQKPKMILLEYMIIVGFIVFGLMTLYTQNIWKPFHVKPLQQKTEEKEQIKETETSFAWDEVSVLV